jgi:homoserine dehydrogenase
MGWPMVAIMIVGFGIICGNLARNIEERHFHLSAGLGELLGILLVGYNLL